MSKKKERFTLFYNGPFCQWEYTPMVIDGIEYESAEQYMMAQKALMFGDRKSHRLIMKSNQPSEQKELGRRIEDFSRKRWEKDAKLIVYRANLAKFTQSSRHYDALMETTGTTLVEASPTDRIWGIGLDEMDPDCHDRRKWRGLNWLGEIITRVRGDILNARLSEARAAAIEGAQ